jgi:Flp pilus assembly protein TadG
MIMLRPFMAALLRDNRGTMLIETAIIAPVLVLMSLGAYQVSGMVARQSELQSAAAEASAIALAVEPDTDAKRTALKSVIMASTGLSTSKVTVAAAYRCGSGSFSTASNGCGSQKTSQYVNIYLTDTYTPSWTHFGVGRPVTYRVRRYVMIKQVD